MMRGMFALLLLILLPAMAHAQTDPSDAWKDRRATYLQSLEMSNATLDKKRAEYIGKDTGTVANWWRNWKADQPYDGLGSVIHADGTITPVKSDKPPLMPVDAYATPSATPSPATVTVAPGPSKTTDNKDDDLPTGPSAANAGTAPIKPMPVQQMMDGAPADHKSGQ